MTRLLIDSCESVVTMDEVGSEIRGGSILVEGGVIRWVGSGAPPALPAADPAAVPPERMDGRGTIALPGLVNAHHHLFQSMTRVRAQGSVLFDWLIELYPIWAHLDAEWVRAGAAVGLAELALSGCSTTTDHHYVFPSGADGLLEAEIEVATEIGLRFHPNRGSMDLGRSRGGLPPDSVVQAIDSILEETEAAATRFHDPEPGSMLRVAVGPCSPFSASQELMKRSEELARGLGLRLHTHVAETLDEEAFCLDQFGMRPIEMLEELGYLGPDVWLAHCVHLSDKDIRRIAETGAGVASCPSSNLRLRSGVAPIRRLLDEDATVGLGVDGSASNDLGNLWGEVRQAMLASRAGGNPGLSAREALRLATRGSADCLGRDDVGSLEPGKRADIALFPVDGLPYAGAEADLVAALAYCGPQRVRHLFVEGRPVVREGCLANADEDSIAAEGRRVGRSIAERFPLRAPA